MKAEGGQPSFDSVSYSLIPEPGILPKKNNQKEKY